jgi:hypothetical protein
MCFLTCISGDGYNTVELLGMYKTWGVHYDGPQQSERSSIGVLSIKGKVCFLSFTHVLLCVIVLNFYSLSPP